MRTTTVAIFLVALLCSTAAAEGEPGCWEVRQRTFLQASRCCLLLAAAHPAAAHMLTWLPCLPACCHYESSGTSHRKLMQSYYGTGRRPSLGVNTLRAQAATSQVRA